MDIETLREFCLSLPEATEDLPFTENILVFKVKKKIFLMTDLSSAAPLANVKCNPDLALELRDRYDYVQPGYHCNKRLWNTVDYSRAHDEAMRAWICHSYLEVVRKLPRKDRGLCVEILRAQYPQYAEIC